MKKPKFSTLFLLGFGFFGISIVWPLYNAYVPIFLKDFSLSSTSIGFIMTIDNIFAIFMLPLIGVLSDQTRTRLGRRMPYILFGAPLAGLFFALIPITRELHLLWFMMLNIIFMNFFMALFRSPVIALMPDITPSKYRSQANGIINFMGGLGALIAYFVGKPLYDKNYALPFWLGALVMVIALILVVFFIKEDEKYRIKNDEKIKLNNVFKKQDIHIYGGQQIIDFVSVEIVVEALIQSLFNDEALAGPTNVGSGKGTTLFDLANRIMELTRAESQVVVDPPRSVEVVKFTADVTRFKQIFNVNLNDDPLYYLPKMIEILKYEQDD